MNFINQSILENQIDEPSTVDNWKYYISILVGQELRISDYVQTRKGRPRTYSSI